MIIRAGPIGVTTILNAVGYGFNGYLVARDTFLCSGGLNLRYYSSTENVPPIVCIVDLSLMVTASMAILN